MNVQIKPYGIYFDIFFDILRLFCSVYVTNGNIREMCNTVILLVIVMQMQYNYVFNVLITFSLNLHFLILITTLLNLRQNYIRKTRLSIKK